MARPQKDGLDYFPHDVDASSDPKIEPLILLYDAKGYGFYFMHLEYIYKSSGFCLDISDAETRQIFCKKLGITENEYQQILNTALKHGCFDKEFYQKTGKLTSNGIKKRAAVVLKKREKTRSWYESKDKIISVAETGEETMAETPQSKVKKSKVKNNIYSSKAFAEDSDFYVLSIKLRDLIIKNNPEAKQPDLQKWAAEFEKMIRLDKRNTQQIIEIIEFSQNDAFWKSNILSPKKLREKYDTLNLQRQNKKEEVQKDKPRYKDFDQRKYDKDYFEKIYKAYDE